MRWRLRRREFNYDVIYCPGLVHHGANALLRLLYISDTQYCKIINKSNDSDYRTVPGAAGTEEEGA